MTALLAADIALSFNTVNERKTWVARPNARDTGEVVHFIAPANLITLVLDCNEQRFEVRFNKVHAAWGDYVRAIARSLHVVLTTLKAAGLPFDAPETPDGIEIIVTNAPDSTVYVRWPEQTPVTVADAIMPELREQIEREVFDGIN